MKGIDSLFSDITNKMPGCALSIIKEGDILFSEEYGLANLEHDIPINENSVFHLCSVSKQFTAYCIALLEEKRVINKNDDIRDFFPELKINKKITIDDLIHMKSGLKDAYHTIQFVKGINENEFINEEELLDIVFNTELLDFDPGEKFSYSNTNYLLLSQLIKRTTKKTLSYFAEENVFKPLNMNKTFFRDDATNIIKNRVEGYCNYDFLHYTDKLKEKYRNDFSQYCLAAENTEATGAGQVWSTINDLYKWIINYEETSLTKKLFSPSYDNNGNIINYGYGQFLYKRNNEEIVFHEGGSVGHNSLIYMIPEKRFSVILLANSNDFLMKYYKKYNYNEIGDIISDVIYKNKTFSFSEQIDKKKYALDNLFKIEGYYQNPKNGSICKITIKDNKCIINFNNVSIGNLVFLENDIYEIENDGVKIKFDIIDNTINKMIIMQENNDIDYIPFLKEIENDYFDKYEGEYHCKKLNCTYIIKKSKKGLHIINKDRHKRSMDFEYLPSINNFFYTYQPPYISDYFVIEFKNNKQNIIDSFIIKDYSGSSIDEYLFLKNPE